MSVWVVAAALLVALAGGAPPSAERTAGELRLHLSVNKETYHVGEAVRIRLRVTNLASGPLAVTMRSGQQYDVIVRQRGALIWQWSHDKAFVQVIRESTLAPGETLTFTGAWDQRDLQGRQVEPGAYEIWGVFLGVQRHGPPSVETGPVRIVIGR
ncbi:MAG: hypothetical protein HY355_02540 [Armatimonadetes bacterium]|nr:hypothetical protein [Armatimonadota bacterium]